MFARANTFSPPHPPLPWSWLDKRFLIASELTKRWKRLLTTAGVKEHQYGTLISDYPAFFLLGMGGSPYFAISELRLGADYVVDLVIASDEASGGMVYTLIELERPQDIPFKANGDKRARLSHALDQVGNWKRWIEDNRREARRLFPCGVNKRLPILRYRIVIGTGLNTEKWTEKRNDFATKTQLDIRSYDSLTEHLRVFPRLFQDKSILWSAEERDLTFRARNALANPFFRAFTDAEWRRLATELADSPHFTELNAWVFLKHRSYVPELRRFQRLCETKYKHEYNEWLGTIDWDAKESFT
jgi:hypothetical protein